MTISMNLRLGESVKKSSCSPKRESGPANSRHQPGLVWALYIVQQAYEAEKSADIMEVDVDDNADD